VVVHPTRIRRLPSFDYVGPHRYSLTLCAFARDKIFVDAEFVDVVIDQILRAANDRSFEVLAYCVMPDHVHLVVDGTTASSDLAEFVKHAKQLSGYHGKQFIGGRIWQTGYFERVLRENEDSRDVVAYVLANPVRAGLVAKPDDWPFIGSGVCSLKELLEYVQDCARPT
jgi:REP-associated tyrosine transposase